VVAGAEVVIVGTSLPANVLSISVRNDVPMPSRDKGYPALMNDFKGKKTAWPHAARPAKNTSMPC